MSAIGIRGVYALAAVLGVAFLVVGGISYTALTNFNRAFAQLNPNQEHTLSVTGTGSLTVTPDQVALTLGVDTQAPTAADALRLNAQAMEQVVKALKNLGLTDKELRTATFTLQPLYIYPEKERPILVGYRVTNTVTITTTALNRTGEIVDTAVAAGANRVDTLYFTVSDAKQRQLRNDAITRAIDDAKGKAEKALSPLNLHILGVKTMSIGEAGYPIPYLKTEVLGPTTPLFPGEQQVTVTVQITFLIGP